jgi:pyruvate dehydrogenase E2 component (dihydrolipoamide acetyltransferase)
MPKLGLTMTEGMVAQWKISEGQRFTAGTVVVVIESEKTAFEVEAPEAGTLQRVLVAESETVPVGTLLAHWHLDGDDALREPSTLLSVA